MPPCLLSWITERMRLKASRCRTLSFDWLQGMAISGEKLPLNLSSRWRLKRFGYTKKEDTRLRGRLIEILEDKIPGIAYLLNPEARTPL